MDANPPISAEELKAEFDKLSEIFLGHSTDEKFNAASKMMVLISRYLSNNIQSLDTFPITTVLGEYARIANGGKPEFLKSQKEEGGRPIIPSHHLHIASIVAAVDILSSYGSSVADAIKFAAENLGLQEIQVEQCRADFNRRNMLEKAKEFKRQQTSFVFASEHDAKAHALALLAMVKANQK